MYLWFKGEKINLNYQHLYQMNFTAIISEEETFLLANLNTLCYNN